MPGGNNLEASLRLLDTVCLWISRESGIQLSVREAKTVPGDFQIEIPVEYSRGGARRQGLPQVKVHLTFDEPVLDTVAACPVQPGYSDLPPFKIAAYSKTEILAEKLRSLLQQQQKWPRPRDLYDLWYILCKSAEHFSWKELNPLFDKKCLVRGLQPDITRLTSETLREWNEKAWHDRLGPMLKDLPGFESVWSQWIETFKALIEDTR